MVAAPHPLGPTSLSVGFASLPPKPNPDPSGPLPTPRLKEAHAHTRAHTRTRTCTSSLRNIDTRLIFLRPILANVGEPQPMSPVVRPAGGGGHKGAATSQPAAHRPRPMHFATADTADTAAAAPASSLFATCHPTPRCMLKAFAHLQSTDHAPTHSSTPCP